MNTPNLRYFLYGIVLTASLSSLASQAAGPDGVFGDYFQNMITDAASCGAGTAITGFDSTLGTGFGTQECTTFDNIVNAVLQTFGTAPVGQAVIGYDPATGHPIYGDVNWQRSGANISYTPGRVGIGTATPSQALDVQGNTRVSGSVGIGTALPSQALDVVGNARVSGNVGIGTSAPAYTVDINGEVINNGWYRSRGDTGMYNETYGGGIYMIDSTWVRTYNAKSFWTNNFLGSNAGLTVGYGGASSPAGGAIIAGNVGIGTSAPATTLQVNGNIQAAGSPVPSNWYNLQAGSIGASTVYGYNSICTGNSSGVCNGVGGVVLDPGGSIGIGGPTESNGWGLSVHKDSWAMVTRRADGGDNAEPQNPRGSVYANDMYLRSVGKWASQIANGIYANCGDPLNPWTQIPHGKISTRIYSSYTYTNVTCMEVIQCWDGSMQSNGGVCVPIQDVAGTCFPKGTPVLMASGDYKSIENIKTGEKVKGMNGSTNTVRGLWRPKLGDRTLYSINGDFKTTGDHMILAKNDKKELSWGSIEPALNSERRYKKPAVVHTSDGGQFEISNSNIDPNAIIKLNNGVSLVDYQGKTIKLNTPEKVTGTSPDDQLYTLYTDNTESFVVNGGYVVDGMPQRALSDISNNK